MRLAFATIVLLSAIPLTLVSCTPSAPVHEDAIDRTGSATTVDVTALPGDLRDQISADVRNIPFERIQQLLDVDIAPQLAPGELAQLVHQRINEARGVANLPRYRWADSLAHVALLHSEDMAERSYFGHESPEGHSVNHRAAEAGYHCERPLPDNRTALGFGENLSQRSHYRGIDVTYADHDQSEVLALTIHWHTARQLSDAIVDGWLGSPGHRDNLMSQTHTHHGIGIAKSADQLIYITQVLC